MGTVSTRVVPPSSAARRSSFSRPRATSTRLAPAPAKRLATEAPTPSEPPVTRTVRPLKSAFMGALYALRAALRATEEPGQHATRASRNPGSTPCTAEIRGARAVRAGQSQRPAPLGAIRQKPKYPRTLRQKDVSQP